MTGDRLRRWIGEHPVWATCFVLGPLWFVVEVLWLLSFSGPLTVTLPMAPPNWIPYGAGLYAVYLLMAITAIWSGYVVYLRRLAGLDIRTLSFLSYGMGAIILASFVASQWLLKFAGAGIAPDVVTMLMLTSMLLAVTYTAGGAGYGVVESFIAWQTRRGKWETVKPPEPEDRP